MPDPAMSNKRETVEDFMERHPWFGPSVAAAQHQDQMAKWPAIGRWLHRILRPKCPACVYWHKERSRR